MSVNYTATPLTATPGQGPNSDYIIPVSDLLIIPSGISSGTIVINVIGDDDPAPADPDETLTLTLSNPVGAILGNDVAIGTIVNDDGPFGYDIRPTNTTCIAGDRPTSSNPSIRLERIFPNLTFSRPISMQQAPNDNSRWYVAELFGEIKTFINNNSTTSYDLFLDINRNLDARGEGGLLGMAFHPDYPNTGYVYLNYTTSDTQNNNGPNFRTVISRFTLNNNVLDPNSEFILLTIPQPFGNHNGGNIAFGPDGYLYIGMGDGGDGGDPFSNSQNTQNLLGSMLRIDVDGTPYSIPADNPFHGNPLCNSGVTSTDCPEIYAWGLRNPWRWSFDRATGALFAGDVGQASWEEIDRIQAGNNYGWHCYEGYSLYNWFGSYPADCNNIDISDYTFPIAVYDHNTGYSITGGYVYRGTVLPSLTGSYIYGDFVTGAIWNLSNPYTNPSAEELTTLTGGGLVSFSEDIQTGELYILNFYDGGIYGFVDNGGGSGNSRPELQNLSTSGCADPNNPRLPTPGMIPYDLNSPLWSDNAHKERWLSLPDGTQISILPYGDWQFPSGSVLRKDFYLSNEIVETRLLMRHNDGGWAGYSYEWNGTLTDANLLPGEKTKFIASANQNWTYPSPLQCIQCHTSSTTFTLGPETAQLNRDYNYNGVIANQITTFAHIDLFDSDLPETAFKIADYYDSNSYSVSERARSYLHSNCSNCHRHNGTGRGSADFSHYLPFADMNICNVMPVAGSLGISNARLLVPGNPSQSIISVRMKSLDNTRMPLIGSSIVHDDGARLIDDWILSISSCH